VQAAQDERNRPRTRAPPRLRQLALPLRYDARTALQALQARQILCEHYRCAITREACEARQLARYRAGKHAPRDDYCRTGDCVQGRAVLLETGALRSRPCPACGGSGRVVCE